ncbi:MAG: winged helix-turn-helix transcriptional regulator [Sphaerochaetaceae bacterium]|nr:winged helix-turn-helix transcriptional regulator [Sphaerochaetaceae bacterium]
MNTTDLTQYESSARLLKVLGHPVRLAILESLYQRSWCVCEIADSLGLNKSAASKHLSLLKRVGVVAMERHGTQVICTLAMPCVLEMLHCTPQDSGFTGDSTETSRSTQKDEAITALQSCSTGTCARTKEKT